MWSLKEALTPAGKMDDTSKVSLSFVFGSLAVGSMFMVASTVGQAGVSATTPLLAALCAFVFTVLALATRDKN